MAQIVINEVSQNYTYNIGSASFATVALPITACWGPAFMDPSSIGDDYDQLESLRWQRFSANQKGMESFVSTYRGPASMYRLANDYSYQMAMTLLTAGYDVLVCRLCPGTKAQVVLNLGDKISGDRDIVIKAKYPGTFGNNLKVTLSKKVGYNEITRQYDMSYWNMVVYIVDAAGVHTAVENLTFVAELKNATDTIPHIDEMSSEFVEITECSITDDIPMSEPISGMLIGGSDKSNLESESTSSILKKAYELATSRYNSNSCRYLNELYSLQGKCAPSTLLVNGKAYNKGDIISYTTVIKNASSVASINGNIKLSGMSSALKLTGPAPATPDPRPDAMFPTLSAAGSALSVQLRPYGNADLITFSAIGDNISFSDEGGILVTLEYTVTGVGGSVNISTTIDELYDSNGRALSDISAESKVELKRASSNGSTSPDISGGTISGEAAEVIYYKQWLYTYLTGYDSNGVHTDGIYDLLKDKLSYNPQRVISPGWDDQNLEEICGQSFTAEDIRVQSPIHIKLMDIGYNSRCATSLLDVPKSLPRSLVYNESIKESELGYVQKLARYLPSTVGGDVNSTLYSTHSALFAPWGQYTYVGTSKQAPAPPAFLYLMISRAMILNQTLQYEWALPTNRKHNLRLGKLDYTVPHKLLNEWQKLEGVGVNVITSIPDMGNTVWGNSTLYEVPPATYQALSNLSTRYLVNAVEDVVYRCGISITFQYNNEQAYNKFYAGVTPTLDTMKNVGAIDDYYVRMAADINGLDQVNANTVIGKVYLVVNGVINDIIVDLVALPPGTDLNQYKA